MTFSDMFELCLPMLCAVDITNVLDVPEHDANHAVLQCLHVVSHFSNCVSISCRCLCACGCSQRKQPIDSQLLLSLHHSENQKCSFQCERMKSYKFCQNILKKGCMTVNEAANRTFLSMTSEWYYVGSAHVWVFYRSLWLPALAGNVIFHFCVHYV